MYEAKVKLRASIIDEARQQLQKKNVPAEESERLLHLLNLLMSGMGDTIIQNEDFSTLLVETILNNGNLITIVERQAAELDALKHITRNLTSTLDLQVVLDQVVQEAMLLVEDAHEAHIYLYDDKNLIFGAALNEDGTKNIQVSTPRPNGLTYTVAHQKQMLIVEDMENHALFVDAPKPWKGSILGLPLIMGGRVVGVMNLVRSRKGEFSQPEIRLLALLADQAAIAIINARLHTAVSRQAMSDTLTRLPNRRALDERLDEAISHSSRSNRPFSVVMMDLDGFKTINDTFGHDIGDDVLRQIAVALTKSLRATDFLARYGGDEMTLILPDTNLSQATHVTRKLQQQLQGLSISLPDGNTITLGVSGGIAVFPTNADTAPGLLRAADEALYQAKKNARGTFVAALKSTSELKIPRSNNSIK
jgi:diguanylate cyclase (GGDEF)-like protein